MARYTVAQLPLWLAKHKALLKAIHAEAVNENVNSIPVVVGRVRGGDPDVGEIPRDTGELAASRQFYINGTVVSHLHELEMGDEAMVTWGSSDVHYAGDVHDDTNYPGTYWAEFAAEQFPYHVKKAVAKAIALFQ